MSSPKIGPGNLPQWYFTGRSAVQTPTLKETKEYNQAVQESEARGYESHSEKHLIARYELLYTTKRDK